MFIGHYAPALVAKAASKKTPLWLFLLAAQFIDILWCVLILTGIEKCHLDNSLPGAPIVLEYMPWSHSLIAVVVWSIIGFLVGKQVFKLKNIDAIWLAAVVFSHWVLDLVVHRPDLPLWLSGEKFGLALWNRPVLAATIEMSILGLAGTIWISQSGSSGKKALIPILFLALLFGLQILEKILPVPANSQALAMTTLSIYITVIFAGGLCERR